MSIKDELSKELQDAIRSADRRRREAIREIETLVSRKRSEPGFLGAVDDDVYLDVMSSFAKKMDKAAAEYDGLGERGMEMAAKLRWEVDNVREVYLDGQGVVGHGDKEACPPHDTTYDLHVVKADGSTTDRRVTVTVTGICAVKPPGGLVPLPPSGVTITGTVNQPIQVITSVIIMP